MPTLSDVARHAGVSRSTVSLVLRESPLVADGTRARVREAMHACGYVYNRHAANLRTGGTQTIGIVVSDFTNPFYAELAAGAETVFDQGGQVAFVSHTEESLPRQERFLRRMLEQRVDGVLISAAGGTRASALQPFVDAGIPVVQVLRAVDSRRFDYVTGDNRLGVSYATEHVLGLGHRRIAYLATSVASSVSEERYAGYADALGRHGLDIAPELVATSIPRWSEAKQAMTTLLSLARPPTALVCFNDLLALGAMLAITESGRRPGRDIAVVGFDDIELASVWRPGLTTVAVRPREIGREAGRILQERIAGSRRPAERVQLAPRLVVRESCGASASTEA
jgi:LacI family transcriptional regulator